MTVSIRTDPNVTYPAASEAFSPSEAYPEYALGAISTEPNPVYGLVRDLFAQVGLDKERFGRPDWNPLGAYVQEGMRVFVLCNFVYHRRPHEDEETFSSKCIHASVLRAVIDYALLATGENGCVRFGNSPLQATNWEKVLQATHADRVAEFYASRGLPVEPVDLRLFVTDRSPLGHERSVEKRDESLGIHLDLGGDSILDETTDSGANQSPFRISDYDPQRIESFHRDGHHEYVIRHEVLESDVIISLSKLKTHEKVGITCGLKGFVGSVGHKDCLAHHRFGSPKIGGDEYPSSLAWLHGFSRYADWVNRRDQSRRLQRLYEIVGRNVGRVIRRLGVTTTGAWHGNDTCWRMTMDLARILFHADREGRMHDRPVRRHLSLIDGIVAGEGDGPLDPRPVSAGTLVFGDDVAVVDRVAARLMGYDPAAIPLVREAFSQMRWPITQSGLDDASECIVDGARRAETALAPLLGRPFLPPSGWRDHLTPRSGRKSGS